MKKLLTVTLVMMMVLGLMGGAVVADNDIPSWAEEVPLLAGQDNEIGTVYVWNDADNLYVEFQTYGYGMTETHLHVAEDLNDIPTNRPGNPIPGQFDYQGEHRPAVTSVRYTIDVNIIEDGEFFIAAHASVGAVQTGNIVSDNETLYYCETQDWVESVATWDQHNQWQSFISNNPILEDSTWIWNAYEVAQFNEREYVDFKRAFNIDGMPMAGTLYITTDNGYEAYINDEFVEANGLWSSLQTVDVLEFLLPGENLLEVEAYNLPGTVYTSNPAGLIYNLVYSYVDVDNSAWADGTRFVERGNWATYFGYKVVDPVELFELTFNIIGDGQATGDGFYAAGTVVDIEAIPDTGNIFQFWSAPAGTFGDIFEASTTFTMPEQDVTVTARFMPEGQYLARDRDHTDLCELQTGSVGIIVDTWDISEVAAGTDFDFYFHAIDMPDRWTVWYGGEMVFASGWVSVRPLHWSGQPLYAAEGVQHHYWHDDVDASDWMHYSSGTHPQGGLYAGIVTKEDGKNEVVIRSEGGEPLTVWFYKLCLQE